MHNTQTFPPSNLPSSIMIFFIINSKQNMQREASLPSIRDMYNWTRQNHDYNVIKHYEGLRKNFAVNSKPTKKDHYLDQQIKLSSSPGPANQANKQSLWLATSKFQAKRAPRETYLDLICKRENKNNSPSPNHYNLEGEWPKKRAELKVVCEKINFADTCEFDSDKIPGPGNYNIRLQVGSPKNEKKWAPVLPIQPREQIAAENGNYTPCPVGFNTFQRHQLNKTSQNSQPKKSPEFSKSKSKQNLIPGPGAYSTISFWPGKSPQKKNQIYYFSKMSKGPSARVYH